MSKTYRMTCVVCRRPLMRAAALKGGQPVGRVCAENAGLLKRRAVAAQLVLPEMGRPDTQTIDLFETA